MTRPPWPTLRRSLFLALILALAIGSPAAAKTASARYLYLGPQDGVQRALALAGDFLSPAAALSESDVIVINGVEPGIPAPQILDRVSSGAGLVIISGTGLSEVTLSQLLARPGEGRPVTTAAVDPVSLIAEAQADSPLVTGILWSSAPQVRERVAFGRLPASMQALVNGYEDQTPILFQGQYGRGAIFVLAVNLGEQNAPFQEWGYFNYLIYQLVTLGGGLEPLAFGSYPAAPLPQPAQQAVLLAFLAGAVLVSFAAFFLTRRYSLANPQLLDGLVGNHALYTNRQAGTQWEEIGFHRPLGGFLLAFMLGLVLFIPLIIYQNLILPVYILPSAQALGIWGRVVQFFNSLWLFFDMGTSAAFIKFFAQYRVHDPRKAILYGQVFVWWQALSGALQVAAITLLASVAAPGSEYAIYAWSIIIHAFIQLPGFFQLMRHALLAWQRFDYAQILDLSLPVLFPMITQPLLVTVMVIWGRSHPVFGASLGGLFGMGLAAYASEALTFILGLWLYRRLGYNARLLFLAHFDWETVKSSLRFGVFEMFGAVAWAGGQALEVLITQVRLVNYTEIWGNWGLAQNFIYAFNVLQTLYANIMPSISEAISNTRRLLSQYYSAMAYKWGGLVSAYIGAVLLAIADRFILGASGPEFSRAALYAIPLIIWGAAQYPSWVGDYVQLASNRPYLKTALVAGEQIIRISLAWVLLERFQVNALILAYFVGLLAKGIAAYFVNHRLCYPQRFYVWQSLTAPLLAGAIHYLILRTLTGFIWKGDQITSILIFLIGILLSFPLYAFLYALFGGWDQSTLAELEQASALSGFMRPLAGIFVAASRLGARLSPLHGRFPITIRRAALDEAQSLTGEKVQL